MACPLCGDDCHCHASHATGARPDIRASLNSQQEEESRYVAIEDDAPDRSEEQFAASVDEEQFGSATLNEADTHAGAEKDELNYRARAANRALTGIERRMAEERALEQQAERWRDEVADCVEGYRQKRSRKQLSGEFSMRFEWEQPQFSPRTAQAAAAAERAWITEEEPDPEPMPLRSNDLIEPEPAAIAAMLDVADAIVDAAEARAAQVPMPVPEPPVRKVEPQTPPPRRLRNTNLIQFPRLPFMPPPPDELADPVIQRPRILDVPDEIVQELAEERTPLGDITLEPNAEEQPRNEYFDVPPQVAPLTLRFSAAVIDAMVVVVAYGVFMMAAQLIAAGMPRNRMALAAALAMPGLLWAIYQYIFLVYGAVTPGMRATHLQVRTFDGEPGRRIRRRWRALAMMLSFMPLGLGLAWAFADDDMLCWHDRITRTYLSRG